MTMTKSAAGLKGPIAYMAGNHVAANILMLVFLVGGLLIGRTIKQEVFPEFELDMVTASVIYPGATPGEVEDGIVRPIELAVSGIDNIKRMRASAQESIGSVTLEVLEGADTDQVLQDVKAEVDRITTFPEEAEKPLVSKLTNRREVISLIVYGDLSERALCEQAERVRDDLQAMAGITQVDIAAARPYEIAVEIPEEYLRKYNLTLGRVAAIIRASSLDLAGGSIKSDGGEVLIRTAEKRLTGSEFDSVAVFTHPNGQRVLLGDIGNVKDGFAEVDYEALFDGKPAVMVRVYRVGDQRPTDIAELVHSYIAGQREELPASIGLAVYGDRSKLLEQRFSLLIKNGSLGLVLVLITLALFLEVRLALWVAMGIVISFLGALLVLPPLNISINMMSLFAFLTILGIVVDDAIVVGENIYVHRRRGKPFLQAAVDGTREVGRAVVFAGLTTVCAFGALLFVGGFIGNIAGVIPKIVIAVLAVSIIEALFILPAHLSGGLVTSRRPIWDRIEKHRRRFDELVMHVRERHYARILGWSTHNRYITLALAIAILMVAIGMFRGGLVKFIFFPEVEADELIVTLVMPPGTPYQETRGQALYIQEVGEELLRETDQDRRNGASNLKHRFVLLGQQLAQRGPMGGSSMFSSNLAQVRFLLDDPGKRTISTAGLAKRYRERVGEIPGAKSLAFQADLMQSGGDIEIELSHSDYTVLLDAVARLKEALRSYSGAGDITDSHGEGKRELKLNLRPEASSLGITERELALQVRSAFYGTEALRIQRGQNEIKVMVRYPEKDRRTLASIEKMRIRTAQGQEIPLLQAANIQDGRGYGIINRTDRRRVVTISARVNKEVANATEILGELQAGLLLDLTNDYPGLTYDLEGRSRDQRESIASMRGALLFSIFLIYAVLAIPFRSFTQPLAIMSAIPFGVVGALIGHMLFGYNLSMISLVGMVALGGVVVNDSLVMIDFINRARGEGLSLRAAVMTSGQRRFRPIIMTSLTTFLGLMPMIMETSLQARFLVPMAISLGFGVLFATGITLVLIPVLYLIIEDLKSFTQSGAATTIKSPG